MNTMTKAFLSTPSFIVAAVLMAIIINLDSKYANAFHLFPQTRTSKYSKLERVKLFYDASSNNMNLFMDDNDKDDADDFIRMQRNEIKDLKEKMINKLMIEKIFGSKSSKQDDENVMMELDFVYKGLIPNMSIGKSDDDDYDWEGNTNIKSKQSSTQGLFLLQQAASTKMKLPSLPVLLSSNNYPSTIKLISFAFKKQRISKSICLSLSSILVNRDGTLFDNLPWSTWTIDPLLNNRDASKVNRIEDKYHLGKRDAYNRFMGKDWYGRSLSVGNLAARAKYLLEENDGDDVGIIHQGDNDVESGGDTILSSMTLTKRILDVEIKEAILALAEAEEQYAVLSTSLNNENKKKDLLDMESIQNSRESIENMKIYIQQLQASHDDLLKSMNQLKRQSNDIKESSSKSVTIPIVSDILSVIIQNQQSNAPYRGAIGYKPVIDTKEEMFNKSILPYSSPFDLMKEIINEQLNADIIGCIIENTSLFEGSVVLGGALVLKRKGRTKSVSLDGEAVTFDDSDDDYGNDGILKGETYVVECECDEVIGMALCCGLSISVERKLWDRVQMSVLLANDSEIPSSEDNQSENTSAFSKAIPNVKVVDYESIVIETQGDGISSQGTPLQVPKTTSSFESLFSSPTSSKRNQPIFPTANPIKSIQEYDGLSIQDKAQVLMSLDSFKGKLPRPRSLYQIDSDDDKTKRDNTTKLNRLDELLIPLIDETVRRQLLIRDAKTKGDTQTAEMLENKKSRRHMAKDLEMLSKMTGDDDAAAKWVEESEFYEGLRADITQDEGSYSSYLDRDEWYERNRLASAKKLDKKKFGTLLDGIE